MLLQTMRDNAQGLVAKFIIGCMAIGFVFTGVNFLGEKKIPPRAEVNGEPISQAMYRNALERQKSLLQARLGDQADPAQLEEDKLAGPVLDGLVEEALLTQKARELKVASARSLEDALILKEPAFQENGAFSEARYRQVLARAGMSSLLYRESLGSDIRRQHMLSGVLASAFETDAAAAQSLRLLRQARDVRFFTVPRETFVAKAEATPAEIDAYYAAHKDQFQADEAVDVEYVQMRKQDFYPAVIDEAQVRARYQEELAANAAKVERHAAHILIEVNAGTTREQAMARLQGLKQRLQQGESFEKLATENSQDPGSARAGGDVGYSAGDVFPAPFEAALASLKPGEVSEPVVTDAGVHLVKLLDVREPKPASFEDSRARIELALKRQAAEAVFPAKIETLADQTYTSADLSQAASKLGLTVQRSGPFSRKSASGVLANPAILAAAFNPDLISSGANSQVLEVDDQGVLVLRVVQHVPAAPRPLAEVTDAVAAKVRQEKGALAMKERAEALKAELAKGANLESLAGSAGYVAQVFPAAERFTSKMPVPVMEHAFALPAPAEGYRVLDVLLPVDGDAIVMEVSHVQDGNSERMTPTEKTGLQQFLVNNQGQWLLSLWHDHWRKAADIRYH